MQDTWNVWGKHFTWADPTDRELQCVCMGTGRAGNWGAGWTAGMWKITRKERKHFPQGHFYPRHLPFWTRLLTWNKCWCLPEKVVSTTRSKTCEYTYCVLQRCAGSTPSSWSLPGIRGITSECLPCFVLEYMKFC